jgi:hypothetical protein
MWDGVGGGAQGNNAREHKEGEEAKQPENAAEAEEQRRAAAASALAAFASPAPAVDTSRMQYFEQQAQHHQHQHHQQHGFEYPMSQLAAAQHAANRSLLFPPHAAVDALRRQEEAQLRQRALYELQQRQALQRQELQELEMARQIQQQRVAELVAQSGHSLVHQQHQEGMSILEAIGASASQAQLKAHQAASDEQGANPMDSSDAGNQYMAIAPRGKPEAMATAMAVAAAQEESRILNQQQAASHGQHQAEETKTAPAPTKKSKKRKASSPGRAKKKAASSSAAANVPSVEDPAPPITDIDYENVQALMEQFCKVPLLSEFSRPVSLLHPELTSKYNKIVSHPIDLGHVCRAIRRRNYKNTRAIQLDMWRIFANCIKYHTSPSNKDNAVPSFVSIALHLRDYFNALWQEYMIPSDPPLTGGKSKPGSKNIYIKRDQDRKNRIATTSATVLSVPTFKKTSAAIARFTEMGGRVDKLDADAIFNNSSIDDDGDMDEVVENLQKLQKRLLETSTTNTEEDYNVNSLVRDFRRCYAGDLFESKPSLRIRVGHRIDRLMGKIIVNIYEANSRGVNQSSIWGCMAAAIWARENGKKPYWPALVLGIMAPEDQTEDWHASLTRRNENRLPEKLRTDLQTGKRKAELAIRRQNEGKAEQCSYFLVEFMGTHEFIWVKESDMIETFDPNSDPNKAAAAGNVTKKKRGTRSADAVASDTFATAMEEGRWALEEFEMQLNDTCGDLIDEEEDEEQDSGYSYSVLCQSDDEADRESRAHDSKTEHEMTFSEVEEANELLATDGLLDFSTEGRKMAKKRATAMKKKRAADDRATNRKDKRKGKAGRKSNAEHAKEEKREQRELERRRKKRTREREKVLKDDSKKRRLGDDSPAESGRKRNPIGDKRGRARAVVKAYLMDIAKREDMKPLGLSGVMTMPAAQIDSTGLLGMAIAFRAAAGELDMPESSDPVSRAKPWESIDVNGLKTTKEREEALLKQKSFLEEEIKRIRAATQQRKELKEAALVEKLKMEAEVVANAGAVRLSMEKKPRKKTPKKTLVKSEEPGDGDDAGKGAEEKNVEADAPSDVVIAEFLADNDEAAGTVPVVAVAVDDSADRD